MSRRVEEIVESIRRDLAASADEGQPATAGGFPALRRSEALARLGRDREVRLPPIRSHRPWLGPPIIAVKRLLRRLVLAVLEPHFAAARERDRDLWIVLDEITSRCDELASRLDDVSRRLDGIEADERERGRKDP